MSRSRTAGGDGRSRWLGVLARKRRSRGAGRLEHEDTGRRGTEDGENSDLGVVRAEARRGDGSELHGWHGSRGRGGREGAAACCNEVDEGAGQNSCLVQLGVDGINGKDVVDEAATAWCFGACSAASQENR